MSLSQKHSGKVLVPWFNIAEWKLVYNLIYSETTQDWPKALEILKIWKHRTPLLSAGVEGTLILLEALLVNTNQLSSYESSHIFSTSLIRFLNLCAANSDKQGTFYKTAMKNELPKWLISIRHEIAHSHKIPSQSMLELSLKFCLGWLQGKYWDVQYDNMSDFIVGKVKSTVIEDAIYIYSHSRNGEVNWNNKRLMKRINKFLKKCGNQISSSSNILENINVMLSGEIQNNKEESVRKICELIIDNLALLSTETEATESGYKTIPENFLNKWNNLINIIYENEIMPKFITHLFNFICDDSHDLFHREIGSLWIKEIFKSLTKKEKNSKDKGGLFFKSENESMKNKSFCTEILEKLTPFTLNFLREVLQYNGAPVSFVDDSISLVSSFNTNNACKGDKIFTVSDLNIEEDGLNNLNNEKPTNQSKSRWTFIEDTSPYINLPLGILPHQDPSVNPLLVI